MDSPADDRSGIVIGAATLGSLELAACGRTNTLSETSNEEWAVAGARKGDRAAFGWLVERHQRNVYRLCFRYVNDHHDADDLAQEVFLKAYRSIGRFRGESRFSTWLYRIAVNTCLNFKAVRRPSVEPLSEQLPAAPRNDMDRIDRERRARRVRAAVARLPEKQRMTLILKVYQELTHGEVAGILGSSVGTVKANFFHAVNNLKRLVDEEKSANDREER